MPHRTCIFVFCSRQITFCGRTAALNDSPLNIIRIMTIRYHKIYDVRSTRGYKLNSERRGLRAAAAL